MLSRNRSRGEVTSVELKELETEFELDKYLLWPVDDLSVTSLN